MLRTRARARIVPYYTILEHDVVDAAVRPCTDCNVPGQHCTAAYCDVCCWFRHAVKVVVAGLQNKYVIEKASCVRQQKTKRKRKAVC